MATQNRPESQSQDQSVAGPSNSADNVPDIPEEEQPEESAPQASNGRRGRGRVSRSYESLSSLN